MEVKGGGRALDLWVKVVFFSLPFSCFESQTEKETRGESSRRRRFRYWWVWAISDLRYALEIIIIFLLFFVMKIYH
jgi:hypothetical protein